VRYSDTQSIWKLPYMYMYLGHLEKPRQELEREPRRSLGRSCFESLIHPIMMPSPMQSSPNTTPD